MVSETELLKEIFYVCGVLVNDPHAHAHTVDYLDGLSFVAGEDVVIEDDYYFEVGSFLGFRRIFGYGEDLGLYASVFGLQQAVHGEFACLADVQFGPVVAIDPQFDLFAGATVDAAQALSVLHLCAHGELERIIIMDCAV